MPSISECCGFQASLVPQVRVLLLDANLGENQPKYPVLIISENLQCRSVSRVAVRLYDDLHILIERHEEAQKTLN